jgi:hypothetical protein
MKEEQPVEHILQPEADPSGHGIVPVPPKRPPVTT